MAQITVSEFVGLDGVMEAPGGEDHPDGKGGWSIPFFTPDLGEETFAVLQHADGLLLGRVTYEHFAAAWPAMTDEQGFADRMNSLPKFVLTSSSADLSWNAQPLSDEPVEAITTLKQTHGNLLVLGSGQLVHTLCAAGLVDRWHVFVHPVIVGSGKRLFPDGVDLVGLRLTEAKALAGGVVALTYARANGD